MTKYYVSTITDTLLRRDGVRHDAYYGGKWQPTEKIIEWMAGENDDIEPVSEAAARERHPDAFA